MGIGKQKPLIERVQKVGGIVMEVRDRGGIGKMMAEKPLLVIVSAGSSGEIFKTVKGDQGKGRRYRVKGGVSNGSIIESSINREDSKEGAIVVGLVDQMIEDGRIRKGMVGTVAPQTREEAGII